MTENAIHIPDDIWRTANHLATQFEAKRLADDLATAIAKELYDERQQCAVIARHVPETIEKAPGLMRRSAPKDFFDAIMKRRK